MTSHTSIFLFITVIPTSSAGTPEEVVVPPPEPTVPQATVIPGMDSLTGDLLDLDLGPPMVQSQYQTNNAQPTSAMDLLGDGLDTLVSKRGG